MINADINRDVFKDNTYEFEFYITKKRAADRIEIPAEGLTGLKGFISATDGGDSIHVDLEIDADERTDAPGHYFGEIPGSDITARMFGSQSYDEEDVWIRLTNADKSINVSVKRKAYAARRIRPARGS